MTKANIGDMGRLVYWIGENRYTLYIFPTHGDLFETWWASFLYFYFGPIGQWSSWFNDYRIFESVKFILWTELNTFVICIRTLHKCIYVYTYLLYVKATLMEHLERYILLNVKIPVNMFRTLKRYTIVGSSNIKTTSWTISKKIFAT